MLAPHLKSSLIDSLVKSHLTPLPPSVWTLQAVPDEEPVPHPAFPPPGATATLRHCRVLPEALHRNSLLHLLLPGGQFETTISSLVLVTRLYLSCSYWFKFFYLHVCCPFLALCRALRPSIWQPKPWRSSHGGSTRSTWCGFRGTKNPRPLRMSLSRSVSRLFGRKSVQSLQTCIIVFCFDNSGGRNCLTSCGRSFKTGFCYRTLIHRPLQSSFCGSTEALKRCHWVF